jgi:hypothetical protein
VAASRRYGWFWGPSPLTRPDLDGTQKRTDEFLAELCEKEPQFYSDPETSGTAFGFLVIHLTVHAKDQWRVPWRVRRKLLPALRVATGIPLDELDVVEEVRPVPHNHPNRAARWKKKPIPTDEG